MHSLQTLHIFRSASCFARNQLYPFAAGWSGAVVCSGQASTNVMFEVRPIDGRGMRSSVNMKIGRPWLVGMYIFWVSYEMYQAVLYENYNCFQK